MNKKRKLTKRSSLRASKLAAQASESIQNLRRVVAAAKKRVAANEENWKELMNTPNLVEENSHRRELDKTRTNEDKTHSGQEHSQNSDASSSDETSPARKRARAMVRQLIEEEANEVYVAAANAISNNLSAAVEASYSTESAHSDVKMTHDDIDLTQPRDPQAAEDVEANTRPQLFSKEDFFGQVATDIDGTEEIEDFTDRLSISEKGQLCLPIIKGNEAFHYRLRELVQRNRRLFSKFIRREPAKVPAMTIEMPDKSKWEVSANAGFCRANTPDRLKVIEEYIATMIKADDD
jgi:hypothetical protein